MEKQIEKAIRETLVISNPQSIHLAVKKILLLLNDSVEVCDHPNRKREYYHDGAYKCWKCNKIIVTN
jgi:hypothetical protein